MLYVKIVLCAAGALVLAACNSSSSTASNGSVTGVATASQISVVTAQ